MKKWQEIGFNITGNIGVAFLVAGVLSLILENKSVISAVVILIAGAYIIGYTITHARHIDKKEE